MFMPHQESDLRANSNILAEDALGMSSALRGSRPGSALSQWRADEEFSAYGLSGDEIAALRDWAHAWAEDINRRLYAEANVDDEDGEIQ